MADLRSPAPPASATPIHIAGIAISDESSTGKWRSWDATTNVPLGRVQRTSEGLTMAVAPGEWLVIGDRPGGQDLVDLTHVRAMLRVTGGSAAYLLSHLCALDLGEAMTPNGAAARTPVAGVATELARDDQDGAPSYLLLVSRSFAGYVWDRLVEVAEEIAAPG